MFYTWSLQPNVKHLHKEKCPAKYQEHSPPAARKTLHTVHASETDLIPDDAEVWKHTFKQDHMSNFITAHADNATIKKVQSSGCHETEELSLVANSVKASSKMDI